MAPKRRKYPPTNTFCQGSLWQRLQHTSSRALAHGALQPIETQTRYCQQNGISFQVRTVVSLRDKPPMDDGFNPFLPYEEALYVADATPSHVCVLNKFNVVDHHLLIITRHFEQQQSSLTKSDFLALLRCMREYDSVGFYNSGVCAGASQTHKHLQLIPAPVATPYDHQDPPLEQLLNTNSSYRGKLGQLDFFEFRHCFLRWEDHRLEPLKATAYQLYSHYRRMMRMLRLADSIVAGQSVTAPYNLLLSPQWMLIIPRASECFDEISLNALAFAGTLLVRDQKKCEHLCSAGPLAALRAVTFPAS